MSKMNVNISNISTIKSFDFDIEEKKLNVLMGFNGTGKSSIAKAIKAKVEDDDLSELKSLYYSGDSYIKLKGIKSVKVFNQEYVDNFLFKDDLVNDTFELVFNTAKYRNGIDQLNKKIEGIVTALKSVDLKPLISDLGYALKGIVFNSTGVKDYKKTSNYAKGAKLKDIDSVLGSTYICYSPFIKNGGKSWISWHNNGMDYILNDTCPFCLKHIDDINQFRNESSGFNSTIKATDVQKNLEVKDNILKLKDISSDQSVCQILSNYINDISNTSNDRDYVVNWHKKLNEEYNKLISLDEDITFSRLKHSFENDSLESDLENLHPDLAFYNSSSKYYSGIENICNAIESVKRQINAIKSLVNKQNIYIESLVKGKEDVVNKFLSLAGVPYTFVIEHDGENAISKLIPIVDKLVNKENKMVVCNSKLSYGEKNALSIILFALECDHNPADLVILDDPISSFDNNKKFAILYYLFRRETKLLKSKTVLMLTHDFEVIVDLLNKKVLGQVENCSVSYLYNDCGNLICDKLTKDDIETTLRLWLSQAKNSDYNCLMRLVSYRKYIEAIDAKGSIEYQVVSSLEHRRPLSSLSNLDMFDIELAIESIKGVIDDFDYDFYLQQLNDINNLINWYKNTNSYQLKVRLARLINTIAKEQSIDIEASNDVVLDFIKTTYHIENNYLMVLDDVKYCSIPKYIIAACDEMIAEIEGKL